MKSSIWCAVLGTALTLIFGSGCSPTVGACVTNRTSNAGTVTYDCYEDKEQYLCDGEYHPQSYFPGSTCAEVGYPHFCSREEMEAYGLSGEARHLGNAACDPTRPGPVNGGGGGGGGNDDHEEPAGDCNVSCPSEFSDPQLDAFCRMACCHSVTGYPDRAADTCAQGESIGSSQCKTCGGTGAPPGGGIQVPPNTCGGYGSSLGCSSELPYTCPDSDYCYGSLEGCAQDSDCWD